MPPLILRREHFVRPERLSPAWSLVKGSKTAAVLALAMFVFGCWRTYPLPAEVSCQHIQAVHLGDPRSQVEALLGHPLVLPGGMVASEAADFETFVYDFPAPSPNFFAWRDVLNVVLQSDRVVRIHAVRTLSGPEGYALALEVHRGPDGREVRIIGSAFEKVFSCGPDRSARQR